jgi:hypothetical protein
MHATHLVSGLDVAVEGLGREVHACETRMCCDLVVRLLDVEVTYRRRRARVLYYIYCC